jgi:hypothetical protein
MVQIDALSPLRATNVDPTGSFSFCSHFAIQALHSKRNMLLILQFCAVSVA